MIFDSSKNARLHAGHARHGTPIACVLVTLLTLALTHPHAVLGSNPNPKTRIGGVFTNHRLDRRIRNLHQAHACKYRFYWCALTLINTNNESNQIQNIHRHSHRHSRQCHSPHELHLSRCRRHPSKRQTPNRCIVAASPIARSSGRYGHRSTRSSYFALLISTFLSQ